MKRWMTFGLCIALLGTLAACGNADRTNTVDKIPPSTGSVVELTSNKEQGTDGLPSHALQQTDWQKGTGFDPDTTAILVIDDYGGDYYGDTTPEQSYLNAFDIVKAGRKAGLPILFVNGAHLEGIDRELELWGEHGLAGDEASQPLTGFDVQDSDYLLVKRRYDGFFQTDLDLTLRELGIDTLITFGTDTNICVLQTLSTAYYLGYQIIVPEDACSNELGVGTHEDVIEYFDACYDARIVSTKTIIDEIKAVG